jgi:DNA-binding transcriptional LysR family regulator
MDNWDEIRTAFQVARMGTVSGAAEVLGVHHATVIRHIDALEARLGAKLFQRHARGYTATEAGEDLLQVASATDDQFSQLASRIKGSGSQVSGDLVVTSLTSLGPWMTPLLAEYQRQFPDVTVRYLSGDRVFRLEYGEAHVAVRAGSPPDQPDNVVQPLKKLPMGVYARRDYVSAHGMPEGPEDFGRHRFICHDNPKSRAPHYIWMRAYVPEKALTFRTDDPHALDHAVLQGVGIGFLPAEEARKHPDLVEVLAPRPEWTGELWLVTHVDLHRTTKVQSMVKFLKAAVRDAQP